MVTVRGSLRCTCSPSSYSHHFIPDRITVKSATPSHIVPVHKKGSDVSNYRPISLTCVLSKILERIVVGRLFDHFHSNNILHPAQHGIIKHRSTSTNLLEIGATMIRLQFDGRSTKVNVIKVMITGAFQRKALSVSAASAYT